MDRATQSWVDRTVASGSKHTREELERAAKMMREKAIEYLNRST